MGNTMALDDSFGWGRIARLGLVQAALGAVVVLTTSSSVASLSAWPRKSIAALSPL